MAVRRFLKAHRFVIRASTHKSQRDPREVEEEAVDFIASIRRVMGYTPRHERFIINMDQTPIFFSMQPSTTIAEVGQRTINVRTFTSSTMPITVAVSVTASGEIMTPMIGSGRGGCWSRDHKVCSTHRTVRQSLPGGPTRCRC